MLGVGGSAQCGELIGQKRIHEASKTFSELLSAVLLLSILVIVPVQLFPRSTVLMLGANSTIAPDVTAYLVCYSWFLPIVFMGMSLTNFARINQSPGLVSFSLILSSVLNLFLDWFLIIRLEMGLTGAAIASGFSQSIVFFILFLSFFKPGSCLRPIRPGLNPVSTLRAMGNGFSEFLNETSGGLVVFVFNYVLIRSSGIDAVAAFTVINFVFYVWIMVAYSTGEAIQAPISINCGAGQINRSVAFLKTALLFNGLLAVLVVAGLLLWPGHIIDIFLQNDEKNAKILALDYMPYVYPAFFLSGANVVISAFFTAIQKARQSAVIALLRSLILRIGFVLIIRSIFEYQYIFLAIPIAELITLIVACNLKSRSKLTIGKSTADA